jgi:hypothetical protein
MYCITKQDEELETNKFQVSIEQVETYVAGGRSGILGEVEMNEKKASVELRLVNGSRIIAVADLKGVLCKLLKALGSRQKRTL